MAIKSTNNEWLSAVKYRKPYDKHHRRNEKSSVIRSPLKKSSFIQSSSHKNTLLHQTRVSSFFKKKYKRKPKGSENNDICILEISNSAKEIIGKQVERLSATLYLENQSSLEKEIMYDEEALFGPCGDSLNETVGDIEHIYDDTANDTDEDATTNNTQLSPCIISKYRKFSNSDSSGEVYGKSKNKKCESYFKPVGYNFTGNIKKTCIKKLSLKKQREEDLYVTNISSKFECDTESNSQFRLDDNSLSCLEPPSPIVFSDQVNGHSVNSVDESLQKSTEELLIYSEDIKADNENSVNFSIPSFLKFTEENTNNEANSQNRRICEGKEKLPNSNNSLSDSDVIGSYHSCYYPPSPIHFTESLS